MKPSLFLTSASFPMGSITVIGVPIVVKLPGQNYDSARSNMIPVSMTSLMTLYARSLERGASSGGMFSLSTTISTS